MDTLHLSYREVVHEIPYRNLVIMTKDRQRPVYGGEVMKEITAEEYFRADPTDKYMTFGQKSCI